MRRILIFVGGVIALLVLVVVVAFVTLQTTGKDQIAQALSSALGAPVEIGGLSVSIFPTPALTATSVRIAGSGTESAPGLAVGSLRIVPALLSLMPGGTPTIERADLNDLVVSIRRTASGQWLAPLMGSSGRSASDAAPPRGTSWVVRPTIGLRAAVSGDGSLFGAGDFLLSSVAKTPRVAVDAFRVRSGTIRVVDEHLRTSAGAPTVTTLTGIDANLRYVDGALSIPDFQAHLGHSVVRASAEAGSAGMTLHVASKALHNEDLPALLALAGEAPLPGLAIGTPAVVDVTTRVAADFTTLTATGEATIGQLTLGRLTLSALHVPFRLEHEVLTSDPITFTAYGGHQRGHVSLNLGASPTAYALRTTVDQLDVNQALSATTTMKNMLFGTGHLSVDVTASGMSQAAIEQSLTGTVDFAIQNGEVRNLPLSASIDRALGSKSSAATGTKFESFTGTATIAKGQAHTTNLSLKAGDFSLAGAGTLGLMDESLNFVLTAQLSPAKSAQVAQLMPLAKRLENATGEMQVPVKITGTASAPKVEGVAVNVVSKQGVSGLVHQLLKR